MFNPATSYLLTRILPSFVAAEKDSWLLADLWSARGGSVVERAHNEWGIFHHHPGPIFIDDSKSTRETVETFDIREAGRPAMGSLGEMYSL